MSAQQPRHNGANLTSQREPTLSTEASVDPQHSRVAISFVGHFSSVTKLFCAVLRSHAGDVLPQGTLGGFRPTPYQIH